VTLAQLAAIVEALWPIVEPLGEEALALLEGKISAARAAATTLPSPPIAPGVEADLTAAKKDLDDA
jgi:hypothetical protein